MSWIRVDYLMPSHPKVAPLAEALGIPPTQAVGLLVCVWTYCAMYHMDGDTSKIANSHLSNYLGGFDAVRLTDALRATGWIDADARLHDWEDYQGIEIGRREKNRKYMREWRLRQKDDPSDSRKPSHKHPRNGLRKGATYERTNEQTTRAREAANASRAAGLDGPRARVRRDPDHPVPPALPIAETMASLKAQLRPQPPEAPDAGPPT